jgi:hypothetical protein
MKHKRIGGALHNFAHSLLSEMNFVELRDSTGVDRLRFLYTELNSVWAGTEQPHRLAVEFTTGSFRLVPSVDVDEWAAQILQSYAEGLSRQLATEGVESNGLTNITLVLDNEPWRRCWIEADDDRSNHIRVPVRQGGV